MSVEEEIVIEDVYVTYTMGRMSKKAEFVVSMTDTGCILKNSDMKEWTLKHVVKGMRGRLVAHSSIT